MYRLNTLVAPLLALALLLLLQGCWTLERYTVRVRIEADGSYKYFIDGTAVHTETMYAQRRAAYEAKAAKPKAGEAKADAHKPEAAKPAGEAPEAGLAKDLALARKDPRVQDIKPLGGGRVGFVVVGKGSIAGGEIVFQEREKPLSYAQAPGGALSVRLRGAVVSRNAQPLGLKVSGDVFITLAEGIQVLEHNAEHTPTVPGGSYRWHIENLKDPAPHLVIRLPKQ
ncbi:MAG: hypothetical protein KKF77_13400 [Proteobacteria bacterium]|nr:hypothetical protein [Pseudomonadota bacterium]